jgi:putative hydrolase of the HAD superfamily
VPFEFIWFDLGYTLLYKEREKALSGILSSMGHDVDIDRIDRAFHAIDKLFMRERPGVLGKAAEKFMPEYMELLCANLGLGCNSNFILEHWADTWSSADMEWKDYPFVKDILARLRSLGYRLGVISNWDPSAKPILRTCGILEFFDVVVISSEVGCAKPNEKIFKLALDKAGVDASRCLYIGDNYYDDTLGSDKVGMRSLIINRFGRFGVEELENQELIENISGVLDYLERQSS